MYGVISSKARKITQPYGVIGGVTRTIKKIYSVVSGVTKLAFESISEVIVTASNTWTVPSGVTSIDIFCVGGGGGGGGDTQYNKTTASSDRWRECLGSGGGGGYTTTALAVSVTPGEVLTIVIGAGGSGGEYGEYWYHYEDSPKVSSDYIGDASNGTKGGTSMVKNSQGVVLCQALGGNGGVKGSTNTSTFTVNTCICSGADGGSGSGVGVGKYTYSTSSSDTEIEMDCYYDGTNGGDGGLAFGEKTVDGEVTAEYDDRGTAGEGQGSTTRAWGIDSSEYTLYSSACVYNASPNTGHGGRYSGRDGSSGMVLIRCN